ncbi:MAG: ADP-ribosylglycohydrolase family protein [Phycisphaerae bacterium]
MKLKARFEGCMLGLAIGDALGKPTEFLTRNEIRERFGPEGVTGFEPSGFHPPGTYTDDTQMSIAIAEGIIESGHASVDTLMTSIASRFVTWAKSADNNRSPGTACMTACRNLDEGVSWREAGVRLSKGCGTVMRVAPIGLYFHEDLERVVDVAQASATITHGHTTGIAAAAGGALAVALCIRETPPDQLLDEILARSSHLDADYARKLEQLKSVVHLEPDEAMAELGDAWVAEEALANGLYCFLRSPEDYRATALTAANTEGDSDSIGTIAGSVSGAYNGVSAIPKPWRSDVENAAYLKELATRLLTAYETA